MDGVSALAATMNGSLRLKIAQDLSPNHVKSKIKTRTSGGPTRGLTTKVP